MASSQPVFRCGGPPQRRRRAKIGGIVLKTKTRAGPARPPQRPLPVLSTLRGYRKAWLPADLAAGLTLVAIAIPEQIATAHLANMPAVAGFTPSSPVRCCSPCWGATLTCRWGADSTIAPVFAAGVAALVATGTPGLYPPGEHGRPPGRALLVGAGLLRLGWIADFLPLPVIDGLLAVPVGDPCETVSPTVLGLPGAPPPSARDVIDQ